MKKRIAWFQTAVHTPGFWGKTRGPTLLCLVLAAALAGCVPPATIPPTAGPVATETPAPTGTPIPTETPVPIDLAAIARDYPLADGSTSTDPLAVTLACRILDVRCSWVPEGAEAGFERFILPDSESVASSPWAEEVFERIRHQGTHQAYVNLIDGAADFILVARAPSQDEMDAATARGVELDVRPVALDAFVFLSNVENPVRTLALDQARRIYTGEITTWAELGGPAEAVHAYQRDPNSGSQELMQDLVMGGAPMIEAPDMILLSMAGPIHALHDDVWGIGYSVYYYARFIFPDANVRLMGIDGVEPTAESIAGRTYPLTSEVYAVVRGGMSPESPAVSLRDWLLTAEGKAVIAESGYIPMP